MIRKVFQAVFSLWMESFQRAHKSQITLNLEVPLMMKQRVCSEQKVLNTEGHDRGYNLLQGTRFQTEYKTEYFEKNINLV